MRAEFASVETQLRREERNVVHYKKTIDLPALGVVAPLRHIGWEINVRLSLGKLQVCLLEDGKKFSIQKRKNR